MDPAVITALGGAAAALGTVAGAILTYVVQHRRVTVKFETEDRQNFLRDAAEFRKELRDQVDNLYNRIATLETEGEEKDRKIRKLERHVRSLENYASGLGAMLRNGGYEIPPRPVDPED